MSKIPYSVIYRNFVMFKYYKINTQLFFTENMHTKKPKYYLKTNFFFQLADLSGGILYSNMAHFLNSARAKTWHTYSIMMIPLISNFRHSDLGSRKKMFLHETKLLNVLEIKF